MKRGPGRPPKIPKLAACSTKIRKVLISKGPDDMEYADEIVRMLDSQPSSQDSEDLNIQEGLEGQMEEEVSDLVFHETENDFRDHLLHLGSSSPPAIIAVNPENPFADVEAIEGEEERIEGEREQLVEGSPGQDILSDDEWSEHLSGDGSYQESGSDISELEAVDFAAPRKRKFAENNRRPSHGQGRIKDPIWSNFTKGDDSNDKHKRKWHCNYCNVLVSGEAKRLRTHFAKCKKKVNSEEKANADQDEGRAVSAPTAVESEPARTGRFQPLITGFLDKTSLKQQEHLDVQLAKFIYSKNLSFNVVEDEYFKNWCKDMRSSYKPPSRKALGGYLLDKVYAETSSQVQEDLHGKELVMMQDGWSTIQNYPIIAHSLNLGVRNYFVKAVPTETNSKSATYCKKLFDEAKTFVEQQYQSEIIGFLSDNCNAMKSLRKKISDSYPNLHVYGCNSHLLNLVGQDFTPVDLKNQIVSVQKFFRNTHFASASLKQKNGCRPVLPGSTRWNSQIDCFESYMSNQPKYLEISRDPQCDMPGDVRSIIENNGLYSQLEKAVDTLKPISEALDKLQGNFSAVADAIEQWMQLKNKLGQIAESNMFKKRMKLGTPPFAVAAHMLHPKYRGAGLSEDLLETGNSFLESKSPFFVIAASNLALGDAHFYPKSFMVSTVSSSMNPSNWWLAVSKAQLLPKGLATFASTLMKLPASTAGLERSFSTLGAIMSKQRNSLGIEKSSKLCFINQYFKTNRCAEVYIDEENLE